MVNFTLISWTKLYLEKNLQNRSGEDENYFEPPLRGWNISSVLCARRELVRDAFFPGVPYRDEQGNKKYVASGLSLVKARHAAKGNGCSRSRMGAFDFTNFENSIFFIGRDLQKAQCMFLRAIEWNEDWFRASGWNVSLAIFSLKLLGRIFLNEAWKQLEGCMFTCTQMEIQESSSNDSKLYSIAS